MRETGVAALLKSGGGAGFPGNKKALSGQREPFRIRGWMRGLDAGRKNCVPRVLLGWGWREHFALLAGLRLGLRLGRLLDFFSAFIFASHG